MRSTAAARSASLVGQEGGAHGIRAPGGEGEGDDGPEEGVRDLAEQAGPVTDERVGTGRATVIEIGQGDQGVADDVVSGGPPQRRDHGDATGVVLILTSVQTRPRRGERKRACAVGSWVSLTVRHQGSDEEPTWT
jgi:hypothetical protein